MKILRGALKIIKQNRGLPVTEDRRDNTVDDFGMKDGMPSNIDTVPPKTHSKIDSVIQHLNSISLGLEKHLQYEKKTGRMQEHEFLFFEQTIDAVDGVVKELTKIKQDVRVLSQAD